MNLKKIIGSLVALIATSSANANIPDQGEEEKSSSESILFLSEDSDITPEEEKAIAELLEELGVKAEIRKANMMLMSAQGVTGDDDDNNER